MLCDAARFGATLISRIMQACEGALKDDVYLLMPRCFEEVHAVDAADEEGAEDSGSVVGSVGVVDAVDAAGAVGERQPTRH
jgi:hypothetical protein